jgi:hypothetical protein
MRLSVAAWFGVQTTWSLLIVFLYAGHPITAVAAGAIAVVWAAAAVASFRRSQRMFRIAQYWFAFTIFGALTNLRNLSLDPPPAPRWELIVIEAMSIWGSGLWVWLTLGARRYGPWAMKKP